jgi:hypothetical protein
VTTSVTEIVVGQMADPAVRAHHFPSGAVVVSVFLCVRHDKTSFVVQVHVSDQVASALNALP